MTGHVYYQCLLHHGHSEMVTWIEARGAHAGVSVELRPSGEMWEVVTVYEHGLTAEHMKELQQLNRHSLPSIEPMA